MSRASATSMTSGSRKQQLLNIKTNREDLEDRKENILNKQLGSMDRMDHIDSFVFDEAKNFPFVVFAVFAVQISKPINAIYHHVVMDTEISEPEEMSAADVRRIEPILLRKEEGWMEIAQISHNPN